MTQELKEILNFILANPFDVHLIEEKAKLAMKLIDDAAQQPIPQDINMNDRNIQKLELLLKKYQSEIEQQKETIEELKKEMNQTAALVAGSAVRKQSAEIESLKQENEKHKKEIEFLRDLAAGTHPSITSQNKR